MKDLVTEIHEGVRSAGRDPHRGRSGDVEATVADQHAVTALLKQMRFFGAVRVQGRTAAGPGLGRDDGQARESVIPIEQFPADQIERIEVIDSPSARYAAEVSGGIVNIVLKEDGSFTLRQNLLADPVTFLERDDADLFPSASVSWSPRHGHRFRVGYSQCVRRRGVHILDPTDSSTDPLNRSVAKGSPRWTRRGWRCAPGRT